MSDQKQCSNCARWNKPLKNSACSLTANYPIRFKENEKGIYYCDDFKQKKTNT